jgi:hypothetical protein
LRGSLETNTPVTASPSKGRTFPCLLNAQIIRRPSRKQTEVLGAVRLS